MLTTTKKLLRKYRACEERYRHLIESLGPCTDEDSISLLRILELNGLEDALWALRAVPKQQQLERDRLARLFACECVRKTPLLGSRAAVETAERYILGNASAEELAADWAAARADWAAARAARNAWAAARAAQRKILEGLLREG